MPALSMAVVVGAAYRAGLRDPVKLAQAAAIATAESGRDPARLGDLTLQDGTWGPSVGLWQIRSLKAEKGKGTVRDETKLTDPDFNAKSMVSISRSGATWKPWTVTHPTNLLGFARYQAALPIATAETAKYLAGKGAVDVGEAAQDAAGAITEPITAVAGAIADAAETPVRIAAWLTDGGTWTRIAFFAVGGALVLVGANIFARPLTSRVVSGVASVVPAGRAAGAVKTVGALGASTK